jgi:hypothetical protein
MKLLMGNQNSTNIQLARSFIERGLHVTTPNNEVNCDRGDDTDARLNIFCSKLDQCKGKLPRFHKLPTAIK